MGRLNAISVAGHEEDRRMQVVYYLSRGGRLEHPHLLQLPLSASSQALYLRDVLQMLTSIRGKGMPTSFAWSYKRRFKNGFIWQDVSEDDVIFPADGGEYVLKGSSIVGGRTVDVKDDQGRLQVYEVGIPLYAKTPPQCDASKYSNKSRNTDHNIFGSTVASEHSKVRVLSGPKDSVDFCARKKYEVNDNYGGSGLYKKELSLLSGQDGRGQSYNSYRKKIHMAKNETSPVIIDICTDAGTQTEELEQSLGKKEHICAKSAERKGRLTYALSRSKTNQRNSISLLHCMPTNSPADSSCSVHTAESSPFALDLHTSSAAEAMGKQSSAYKSTQKSFNTSTLKQSTSTTEVRRQIDTFGFAKPKQIHLCTSSVFQILSCGALDIKEEIVPVSLYLQTKGELPAIDRGNGLVGGPRSLCKLLREGQHNVPRYLLSLGNKSSKRVLGGFQASALSSSQNSIMGNSVIKEDTRSLKSSLLQLMASRRHLVEDVSVRPTQTEASMQQEEIILECQSGSDR